MTETRIGQISAVTRPSARLRSMFGRPNMWREVESMLDGEEAVDALAKILDVGLEKAVSSDGRVDLRVMAAHVLQTVGKIQIKPPSGTKGR